MAGIDAKTGRMLSGFAHVEQSLEKLFSTPLGMRVVREWVGNPGTKMIGENITERNVLNWATIVWSLVELYEPRYRITRFNPQTIDRSGVFEMGMEGEYLPYGHKDWQQAQVFISVADGVVSIRRST